MKKEKETAEMPESLDDLQKALEVARASHKLAKKEARDIREALKHTAKVDIELVSLQYKKSRFVSAARKTAVKIAKLRIRKMVASQMRDKLKAETIESVNATPVVKVVKKRTPSVKAAAPAVEAVAAAPEATKTKRPYTRKQPVENPEVKAAEAEVEVLAVPTPVAAPVEPVAEKKTRKPRTPKAEATPAPAAPPVVKERKKREAKPPVEEAPKEGLLQIEGVGAAVATALTNGGIVTLEDLAASPYDRLKEILKNNRLYIPDPASWAYQAKLILEGRMDELAAIQTELKASRGRKRDKTTAE